MNFYLNILLIYILSLLAKSEELSNEYRTNGNITDQEESQQSKVLSRRKRFLVFPEGSSVQLVFCNTFPTIFTIGDIFLFGYTAALAWELPQDPYSPFMHHADPLHRRVDTKNVYFVDKQGKVLFKKPYKKKPIVNPAFAKRSTDNQNAGLKRTDFKIDRKQMHASQNKREFLKSEHMGLRSIEFHRSSRVALYEKIESLFKALGANGRQCMLKTLCEFGQTKEQKQAPFLQEILRAVFTLPKGMPFEYPCHTDYDAAHFAKGPCEHLYPECDDSNLDPSSPDLS